MRILVLTRILPKASDSGSAAYLADLLSYLSSHGCAVRIAWSEMPIERAVRYASLVPQGIDARFGIRAIGCLSAGPFLFHYRSFFGSVQARTLHFLKSAFPILARLRRRDRPTAAVAPADYSGSIWDRPADPEELALLRRQIERFRPDVVLVNYPWMLAGAESVLGRPRPIVCVLTHDFRHRTCQIVDGRFFTSLANPDAIEQEKGWLNNADTIVAIQETEARLFRQLRPDKQVVTACKSVIEHPGRPPSGASLCVFVGADNVNNADAARWFLDQVWPAVRKRLPAASFQVAGGVCRSLPEYGGREGIALRGRMDSLAEFYREASVVVVPLLRGSGVKIKLLEALEHGRACVTTSVGLDGLEGLREGLIVADDAPAFAEGVVCLLERAEERERLVSVGQRLTRSELNPDACYGPLWETLRGATGANRTI